MVQPGWYEDPWRHAPLRWWDGERWTSHTTQPPGVGEVAAQVGATADGPLGGVGPLARLLRSGERVAVIDVETTGLYNEDRVVEIAVVTLNGAGKVVDEFDTLVNPGRDVGPTWIHQITASMVTSAPSFDDVAHHVASRVDGAVCVAHNLSFDRRMVGKELARAGIDVDWGVGLDTLSATGCKLGVACADYGVRLDDAHRALADARATAALVVAVADMFDHDPVPASARPLHVTPIRVVTRDGRVDAAVPAPYLAALARGVHASVDVAPYVDLLDAAVADLRLTAQERDELASLAGDLGLDSVSVGRAHREFLAGLIDAALDDGVVTDDEYDQLCRAAALLDVDVDVIARRVDEYRSAVGTFELVAGMAVCFTGAAVDEAGEPIDRAELERIATRCGLVPTQSVAATSSGLLVAADPSTRSGKAEKARRCGVPVASVDAFLRSAVSGEPLAVTRLARSGVPLVCVVCGDSWLATRNSSRPTCAECRKGMAGSPAERRGAAAPQVETLICVECGTGWERSRVRGRKPLRCGRCS